MIILGIDPGLERVGFGVIERQGSRISAKAYGLIETPRIAMPDRLKIIHDRTATLISEHRPELIATERLLFAQNKRTAMDVAKGLGVVLLAAAEAALEWTEMTPPEIKLGVVGNGAADKRQVQFMVQKLLGLADPPKPDDVADALAIAIAAALRSRIN